MSAFTTRRNVLTIAAAAGIGTTLTGTVTARSDQLAQELNAVRSATRQYRDIGQARADGYVVESEYVPQMGFHLINPTLIAPDADAPVDITEPPILVYFTTGNYRPEPGGDHDPDRDDDLRLGAVEFAHTGDEGPPGTPMDLFSDEDASRNLKVTEDEGWEWVPGADITALHVWVHRGNPAGVFNPSNPTID